MLFSRYRASAVVIVAVAFVALMALVPGFGTPASAATQNVTVGAPTNRFSPNVTTVQAGDTVTFTWAAGVHTVVADSLSLDLTITSSSPTGETAPLTTPGTYYFYCSIHAEPTDATEAHVQANDAMVGKIVVVAAGSATTTPTAAPTTPDAGTPTATPIPNGQCVLTVSDAAVVPGTKQITISKSQQGRAGYIAIHESTSAGAPGPVIGITAYQPAGTVYTGLAVTLDRALKDGETLWPMLHTEDNGNTTYDGAAVDLPTIDPVCGNAAVANIVTFPMKITVGAATGGGRCVFTVKDEAVSPNANKITITKSQQARAGYIAIHESTATGAPGPVIGITAFQPAGTVYTNLSVTLDRALKNGETLFPMLHTEDNGNTTYDGAAVDLPTVDTACGNPAIANIATFPMKISFAAAPIAPATGTGVAPSSSSNNLMFLVIGSLLALTVVGGTTLVAVRRR